MQPRRLKDWSLAAFVAAMFLLLTPMVCAASSSGSQSSKLGASTLGSIGDSGNVGLLLAQKADLGTAGTLENLSFYVTSGAGGSMHLAVYSDNGGEPGKLLAKTADFAVANGWNTQPVATQVVLQPGTYWLVYEYTDSSVQFLRFGNGAYKGVDHAWGAFPASWGTSTLSGSDQWSFYATLGVASPQSSTMGARTLGSIGDSGNVGLLLAQKATLAMAGTLQTLSFYVTSGAGGSMHLAVYSDNGGQPGNLLAKTADFAVANGWNTQPVATQVALQPGTYWLAYEYTDSSVQFLRFGNGAYKGVDHAWGALSASWGTSTLSGSDQWSFYATLGVSSVTPPASLISNLVVNDKMNAADWSIQGNLQVGNHLYGDRTYAVASLPPGFAGSAWIRPANDSKLYRGATLVSFKVSVDSTVYVVHSDSAPEPSWLSGWTDTGSKLVSNQPDTYSVYSKPYAAGATVSLGRNADVYDPHNTYVVVVNPTTSAPPPPPPPPPPPASGTATLSWQASTSSTVAGYRIHYGTASGVYTTTVDVGKATTYTIQDLSPGTYYFVVTAYDAAGDESAYSNEVSKTIP